MVREAVNHDLGGMLKLYTHLHVDEEPVLIDGMISVWKRMIEDPDHHVIIYEKDGEAVSSCVCVIIPNITRSVRPYAVIENVVTHADYRGRGFATACLDYARELARKAGCYKIMLMTSAKDEAAQNLYRSAGYNSEDKTAFVQWL